jgi:transcriptional regulator with XRE-family HTH domain
MARATGQEMRQQREDSGLSRLRVAREARISSSHLGWIEAGTGEASLAALERVALALGGDLSLRFHPGTGPRLRDHLQARMIEALLARLRPSWLRHPELPVYRPVRGVIDLVLVDPQDRLIVACEAHSQLRRLEQQLRWAAQKADALAVTDVARFVAGDGDQPTISRLLVLRSGRQNREIAQTYGTTLAAVYPARTADAVAALTVNGARWPGPAVVWTSMDRGRPKLLDGPPRGVTLGR